ncbi:30S ribosomal protein THX [Pontibacter anaerobius]|uniref:30S ribosomal protein THX n=1 Tax=Pontibacter anaerobius TaxID=2993940 RepID=A0ABT3RHT2_9BACT|nr:30S ribosomal protein THX [Pontibacter anaerobius]MCX2741407.1 30S ribosomal protein THX [Pontibacter anaerobius]
MGKGDKKSRKGKITKGTYGKKRTRKGYNLKMKPTGKEAASA